MKLLIFGATGSTGQCLVAQALERGHEVTAFVRDPAKLGDMAARVAVITGDILDSASVKAAFAEPFDAVLSSLGVFHREDQTDLSRGTAHIIAAMEQAGCRRLAVVSSLGAGDSAGQGNWLAWFLQRFLLKYVLIDKTRQEDHIRASALDWTIVRPPQLTDGQPVSTGLIAWEGPVPSGARPSWKTSRATVAAFLLDTVERNSYVHKAVNLSEPR